VTEHTHMGPGPFRGRLSRPSRPSRPSRLSRLSRLGDVPVVVMLAWAGWLAVPWSFSGLAQARAAAAAAAAEAEPPPVTIASDVVRTGALGSGAVGAVTVASDVAGARTLGSGAVAAGTVASESAWAGAGAGAISGAAPAKAWGIPAAQPVAAASRTVRASRSPDSRTAYGSPEAAAAELIALERARIAGEVHDAAGHGLAAIAMQAGLALITLDDDPEQARASLLAIKETSSTALSQLRAALDRLDPRDTAHDLVGLIDGVRAAGLAVEVRPETPVVPAHLGGTVYGVVRESLTNALRHAAPTQALVRLTTTRTALVLEITDQGRTRPETIQNPGRFGVIADHGRLGVVGDDARLGVVGDDARFGAIGDDARFAAIEEHGRLETFDGHGRPEVGDEHGRPKVSEGRGLAGMRARVVAAGGHLTAGPRADGGFQVVAALPLTPRQV
jgi:signal transduction histidine kinase